MRKLVTALCALVFLSSCDDELKLVSRDFSVTLKSIDVGTAVVGKPVNCTLTISDLDPDNGDQILTRFEVRDGDGVILVDNNEYSPGETFEYDFKANNRLDFDFIPATEGEAYIIITIFFHFLFCKISNNTFITIRYHSFSLLYHILSTNGTKTNARVGSSNG